MRSSRRCEAFATPTKTPLDVFTRALPNLQAAEIQWAHNQFLDQLEANPGRIETPPGMPTAS